MYLVNMLRMELKLVLHVFVHFDQSL